MGTLAFSIILFDSLLDPIDLIADAGGPINSILFLCNVYTNRAFSERNPYPGCIA
jgi:hypothetical protein